MTAPHLTCDIPKRLRTRPRDSRGYPVPWIVMVDKTGLPHFTISDNERVHSCITKKLCGLCGKRLDDGMWFIGGPRCFLDEFGAFIDPPNHEECGRFAMQVCPYLAAPRYGKLISDRKLKPGAVPDGTYIGQDTQMILERPPLFMFGKSPGCAPLPGQHPGSFYLRAVGWLKLEVWQSGKKLPDDEGMALAQSHQAEALA